MLQPKGVFIQTINRCNAQCVICPYKDTQKNLPQETMSLELFQKILTDLGPNYSGQIGLYLQYEPFMDERFFDFVKLIRNFCSNAKIVISTNALLLNKTNVDKLCITPVDTVVLNINGGTKETYERMMYPLKWDTMVSNVNYFISKYNHGRYINFIKTSDNCNEVNDLQKTFPNIDILSNFWATNRAGSVQINKPTGSRTRFKNGNSSCLQLETNMSIACNGDLLLCCNCWQKEVVLGNAYDGNIVDIWNNSPKKHYNHEICRKCD
jgi:MoaA/NifB/PqqE/SkfB family radical SAM enzyme